PITGTRLSVIRGAERAASPTIRFRMPDAGPACSGPTISRGEAKTVAGIMPHTIPRTTKKSAHERKPGRGKNITGQRRSPAAIDMRIKVFRVCNLSDTLPATGAAQMIIETGRIASADAVKRLKPRTVVKYAGARDVIPSR